MSFFLSSPDRIERGRSKEPGIELELASSLLARTDSLSPHDVWVLVLSDDFTAASLLLAGIN